MEWSTLSILNATTVQKECEMAVTLLRKYSEEATAAGPAMAGHPSGPASKLSAFAESVRRRIDELEVFYAANDDDDRAILFERERMKLRKALQSIIGTPVASSGSIKPGFFPATTPISVSHHQNSSNKLNIDELNETRQNRPGTTSSRQNSISPGRSLGADSFLVSPRAIAQSKAKAVEPEKMTKKLVNRIYDWEDGHKSRGKIQVDDHSFVPTSVEGVYIREDGVEQIPSSEKWIDIKVVLDEDEIKTLASRKKALKRAQNMGLMSSNFVSIQSSTPYIDPRRIVKETYRPDHPEKWLNPVYHNK